MVFGQKMSYMSAFAAALYLPLQLLDRVYPYQESSRSAIHHASNRPMIIDVAAGPRTLNIPRP